MKSSGITRRIDELGRIVLPKEIRYNLGLRDGDPLEIYIDNDSIVIRKYSEVDNIKDISNNLCNIISNIGNVDVMISDRSKIISVNNKLNSRLNTQLTEEHKRYIDERLKYNSVKKESMYDLSGYFTIIPIITTQSSIGLVFIISSNINKESEIYANIIEKLITAKIDVT